MNKFKNKSVALFATMMLAVAAAGYVYQQNQAEESLPSELAMENSFKKPEKIIDHFDKSVKLTGQICSFDQYDQLFPSYLQIIDSFLITCELDEDKIFNVINLKTSQRTQVFGSLGQGPNEYNMFRISSAADGSLLVYERSLSRARALKRKEGHGFAEKAEHKWEFKPFKTRPAEIEELSNDYYIGVGEFETGLFGLYDKDGVFLSEQLEHPNQQGLKNRRELFFANQSQVVTDKKGRFATAFLFIDCVMFGELRGEQLELSRNYQYEISYPVFEDQRVKNQHQLRRYQNDICATDEFVYVLSLGSEGLKSVGSVLQFDWEGNPIKRYELDRPMITTIAVTKDNTKLFAIAHNDESNIVEFELE